jgi:hypothetical protein
MNSLGPLDPNRAACETRIMVPGWRRSLAAAGIAIAMLVFAAQPSAAPSGVAPNGVMYSTASNYVIQPSERLAIVTREVTVCTRSRIRDVLPAHSTPM